jgi:hypothetical protein
VLVYNFSDGDLSFTYDLVLWDNAVPTPACPDSYEPDNAVGQAHPLTLDIPQSHRLCAYLDEDWVAFSATAGTTYRIETLNLSPGVDTLVTLYNTTGTS